MPLSWLEFWPCDKLRILCLRAFLELLFVGWCFFFCFFFILPDNIAQTLVSKWIPWGYLSVQDEHNTWYNIIFRTYIDLWLEFIDFCIRFGYWTSWLNVATSTTTQNADFEVILKQQILLTQMNLNFFYPYTKIKFDMNKNKFIKNYLKKAFFF